MDISSIKTLQDILYSLLGTAKSVFAYISQVQFNNVDDVVNIMRYVVGAFPVQVRIGLIALTISFTYQVIAKLFMDVKTFVKWW